MRRTKLLLIGVLAAIPVVVGGVGIANAQSFRSGNNTVVPANETVDSSLFIAGKTVDVAGTVNGDVFCAGQNVTVSGTVNGDVMCAGQTVRISGTVNGDVRAAGQTVTVSANVQRNLSMAGQSVTLEADGRVGGDVSAGGQDIVVNGTVGRDLAVGSSSADVNGRVGRNVQAGVDRLTLGSDASVGGTVTYTSKNELTRQPGAQVTGVVTRHEPKQAAAEQAGFNWWFVLWMMVSMLLFAMVLVLLFPRVFHAATSIALRRMGWVFLVGLGASIVAPVVIIGLMFTIAGIPLALFALFVWIAIAMLAGPFAAYLLGRLLLRGRTDNAIWIMLLGAVVLLVVYLIPVLGWLVALVAFWFGLGTILWQVTHLPKLQYRMTTEAAEPPESTRKK